MHKNKLNVRVEFGDCDPARLIYYPHYFVWFDRAAWRYFESAGIDSATLGAVYGIDAMPLLDARAHFVEAVHWGDDLALETALAGWGNKSFDLSHRVFRGDTLCVEGGERRVMARHAADGSGRLEGVVVPDAVRAAIGAPPELT